MALDCVTGWKLPHEERTRLLAMIPPRFPVIVADHVTLRSGTSADTPLPRETSALVVGEIDDGEGVQALLVGFAGGMSRADGGTYHITWSLAAGREAKESNDVIARLGWRALPAPVPIMLQPARWPRGAH